MNYVYPVLRYFCSIRNTPLTESYKSIDIIRSSGEECPKCGSLLSESLKRKPVSQYQRDNSNSTTAASSLLCTQRFHTVSRLNFIKKIDSVCTFGIGECVSLIGNYSKFLSKDSVLEPCCQRGAHYKKKDSRIIRRLQQSDLEIIHQK